MIEHAIVCFTDLVDSTASAERLGLRTFRPIQADFLRVGAILAETFKGESIDEAGSADQSKKYLKNTGDGHLVRFHDLQEALGFVTELQEYFSERPGLVEHGIKIKISLYSGTVDSVEGDVYGHAVNFSARVNGVAGAGQVLVNGELRTTAQRFFGKEQADGLFRSLGPQILKGSPEAIELFEMDWKKFAKESPRTTLSGRVVNFLHDAGFELYNLNVDDLSTPGLVLWPAVPRRVLTAIHRGQIGLIKLLARLGWTVRLIVADCGTGDRVILGPRFAELVSGYFPKQGLSVPEITHLRKMFEPDSPVHQQILAKFQQVTSKLTVDDLLRIHKKGYDEGTRSAMANDPTLDFLRPVLTSAAILQAGNDFADAKAPAKCVLLAGADEKPQWERFFDVADVSHFGAVFHPILKVGKSSDGHTARQSADWPLWRSQNDLSSAMANSNVGKWVFQLHAQPQEFPGSSVSINGQDFSASAWVDEDTLPAGLTSQSLAAKVWPVLDPTS